MEIKIIPVVCIADSPMIFELLLFAAGNFGFTFGFCSSTKVLLKKKKKWIKPGQSLKNNIPVLQEKEPSPALTIQHELHLYELH